MPAQITGVGGSTGKAPTSADAFGSNKLGKDEFLKLLVAQLGAQDPLNPVDNQAFIAQLAQFSAVEQQASANQRLDQLIMAQAAANQTSVANLVGKNIVYKTDKVSFDGTAAVTVQGKLDTDAATVNAVITDSAGKAIRTVKLTNQKAGDVSIPWNGLDDKGNPVPRGEYSVTLTAGDSQGAPLKIQAQASARATGVTFEAGYPELILNGVRVRLADVVQINEPTTTIV